MFIITILSFSGNKKELFFPFWLFILSVTFTNIVNLYFQSTLPDSIAKTIDFGNNNYFGFFSLLTFPYIIFMYQNKQANKLILRSLFYFHAAYLTLSEGRLNLVIFIIFLCLLYINPIPGIWLNRKKFSQLFFVLLLVFLIFNISGSFFRKVALKHGKELGLQDFNISKLEDLKNPNLAAVTSARSVIYYDAIILLLKKPIWGNGFLSWNDKNNINNSLVTSDSGSRISMHSTFLQYLVETGLIGLTLYILYLITIMMNGTILRKSNMYKDVGIVVFFIPLFLLLGSTFDNHSLSYQHIHFIAGLSLVFINKLGLQKFKMKSLSLY